MVDRIHHLLLAAFLIFAGGCNGPISVSSPRPEPRYVELVLPGAPAVPLQVADLTGSLAGAELDVRTPPVGGLDETFLASIAGRPNAVLVGWPGGCEERADVAVDPASEPGARPTFTLKLLPRTGPCGLAIPRRLVVLFDRPIDALGFNLDVVQ